MVKLEEGEGEGERGVEGFQRGQGMDNGRIREGKRSNVKRKGRGGKGGCSRGLKGVYTW